MPTDIELNPIQWNYMEDIKKQIPYEYTAGKISFDDNGKIIIKKFEFNDNKKHSSLNYDKIKPLCGEIYYVLYYHIIKDLPYPTDFEFKLYTVRYYGYKGQENIFRERNDFIELDIYFYSLLVDSYLTLKNKNIRNKTKDKLIEYYRNEFKNGLMTFYNS